MRVIWCLCESYFFGFFRLVLGFCLACYDYGVFNTINRMDKHYKNGSACIDFILHFLFRLIRLFSCHLNPFDVRFALQLQQHISIDIETAENARTTKQKKKRQKNRLIFGRKYYTFGMNFSLFSLSPALSMESSRKKLESVS